VVLARDRRSARSCARSAASKLCRTIIDNESIWAQGCFDLAVIGKQWPEHVEAIFHCVSEGRAHDVLTRERLLDIANGTYKFNSKAVGEGTPGKGYSLGAVIYRNFRDAQGRHAIVEKGADTYRLRYGELMDVPLAQWPEAATKYALMDPMFNVAAYESQEQRRNEWILKHPCDEHNPAAAVEMQNVSGYGVDVLHDEKRQVRAKWALHLSTCWGMRIDQEGVREYEGKLIAKQVEAEKLLRQAFLIRSDGSRDMGRCHWYMEWLCAQKGVEPLRNDITDAERVRAEKQGRPPAGSIKLDGDTVLDPRLGDGHHPDPIWKAYYDYAHIQKLRGTYIQYLKDAGDLPVHPSYNEVIDTGRTSSFDPNIQQLPREKGVRECYRARPGNVLIPCDFVAAELVALAEICLSLVGYSKLADLLTEGSIRTSTSGSSSTRRSA
jgi:DNA polymerase-1